MAGYCLVEGLRELGVERIALNSVYYWPDWRDGIARFLRQAGFDLLYCGNFVDLGLYDAQEAVNAQHWIFPGEMAARSMRRTAERAPGAEAIVVNGMPNFRRADGLPQRIASIWRSGSRRSSACPSSRPTPRSRILAHLQDPGPLSDGVARAAALDPRGRMTGVHRILALWAVPRSTSTAFEWMMRMRGDMTCFHEPFGEAWYQGEAPLWPRVQGGQRAHSGTHARQRVGDAARGGLPEGAGVLEGLLQLLSPATCGPPPETRETAFAAHVSLMPGPREDHFVDVPALAGLPSLGGAGSWSSAICSTASRTATARRSFSCRSRVQRDEHVWP